MELKQKLKIEFSADVYFNDVPTYGEFVCKVHHVHADGYVPDYHARKPSIEEAIDDAYQWLSETITNLSNPQ